MFYKCFKKMQFTMWQTKMYQLCWDPHVITYLSPYLDGSNNVDDYFIFLIKPFHEWNKWV